MGLSLTLRRGDHIQIGDAKVHFVKHRSNKMTVVIEADKNIPISYQKGKCDEKRSDRVV
jgi:sRNA-binding carbon storage regulator CsrA